MDNRELKEKILNNSIDESPLVLKYSDNNFISKSYAEEIAKVRGKDLVYISKIEEAQETMFSDDYALYVYLTDKLDYPNAALPNNLIVICKDISEETKVDFVDMVKAIDWQILDYAKALLPGLKEEQVKWLCDICKYDVYRITNEANKINMFNSKDQEKVFNLISEDDGYSDLSSLNIFNYINYIIKRDSKRVVSILSDLKTIDVEGTGAVTILLKQFLNIINIQINPKSTASSLNMTERQFNAIRNNVGYYSNAELIDIYEFLTGVDQRLKNGELQFVQDNRENNARLVDYITCNILGGSYESI